MKRFSIAVTLATASIVAAGCESSSNPVSSAGPRNEPGATFTLSGVITEVAATGVTHVARAFVQEIRSQLGATTAVDGSYRIQGLSSGSGVVRIVKEGYVTSTSNVDTADARLDVDIEVVRR